jgi:type 1 glutamine amidotransferase
MARPPMFIVTQVAPYGDGPAGVHGVLPQAAAALAELAGMAGLEPVPVTDVAHVQPADLTAGGVLALFTIGETPWSAAQRTVIADEVRSGRLGVLGVHSATDACRDWEGYASLVGARFDGHPWTQELDVEVADRSHPATAHLPTPWRWRDEVYLFRDLRPDAHVVLRVAHGQLDMSVPEARVPACGFPLAWCFTEGEGRSFYTSLGHFAGAWESPVYLRHVAGGLDWVLDRSPGDGQGR